MRKFLSLLMAALLLPALPAPSSAQDEPALRTIELRIAAASRGYCRPLGTTAERIAALEGVEGAEMLGAAGDNLLFEVTVSVDDEALARALGARALHSGEGYLTVGPGLTERARRAEARLVLARIARRILALPGPGRGRQDSMMSPRQVDVTEFVRELGLEPASLDGQFYRLADYHVVESGDETSPNYQLWAGADEWQGVRDINARPDLVNPSRTISQPPESDARFVGMRINRSYWSENFAWADTEGVRLSGAAGRRSDTDNQGVLHVRNGADWMIDILEYAVAYHVRNAESKANELPSGHGGWQLFRQFNDNSNELNRYDVDKYFSESFRLAWEKRDGSIFATLKAFDEHHPFYLSAEVDSSAVLKRYLKRVTEDEAEFSDLKKAELGDALKWIVGPEDGPEVFERRREQALEVFEQIRAALPAAVGEHGMDGVTGTLGEPGMLEKLGVELPEASEFQAAAYAINRQLLGDVELRVGDVRTGGATWMLVNAETGDVIRSSR